MARTENYCALAVTTGFIGAGSPGSGHATRFALISLTMRAIRAAKLLPRQGPVHRRQCRVIEAANAVGRETRCPCAVGVATVNPHSQIFGVAIQVGLTGATVLLAMWIAHYFLFQVCAGK
jgi:hypothetical protein